MNKISAATVEVEQEIAALRAGNGRSRVGTVELLRRVLDALWEAKPAEDAARAERSECLRIAAEYGGHDAQEIADLIGQRNFTK